MTTLTCIRCTRPLGSDAPVWQDAAHQVLCVPCGMGLTLPERAPPGAAPRPRFRLPAAVAASVEGQIDLGTGRSWPVEVVEFSEDGLRLLAPVAFGSGTPAVMVLRDRAGVIAPAIFAVELRWARGAPDGRVGVGARVIAAVDGHHAAFLSRILERVAAAG